MSAFDDVADRQAVLDLQPDQLPAYLDSLAQPSHYNLATKHAKAYVKLALYNWALEQEQPEAGPSNPFRPDHPNDDDRPTPWIDLDSLDDKWTLSSAQSGKSAASGGGDEYSPSRRGKPCGHVFRPGESVYRCRDCGVDPTCVLCAKCFHASGHTENGHDVTTSVHSGVGAGCCDCGDVEAWKEGCQRDCKYHGEIAAAEMEQDETGAARQQDKGKGRADEQDLDRDDDERITKATARVRATLVAALDWALDVLERAPATLELPSRVEEITGVMPDSPPAPEADEDFGVAGGGGGGGRALGGDVFRGLGALNPAGTEAEMPEGTGANLSAASVARLLRETAALPLNRGADGEPANVVLTDETGDILDPAEAQLPPALRDLLRTLDTAAEADEDAPVPVEWLNLPGAFPAGAAAAVPSSSPPLAAAAAAAAPLPPPTAGPYATVLWNDERHSFDQVIHQVKRATSCSVKTASDIAVLVDRQGRAIVRISESASECLTVAKTIAQIGLATTVRSALETWREQVAVEVCTAFVQDLLKVKVAGEAGGLGRTVAQVWLERGTGGAKSRFQRWAGVEERLWKVARKTGQEVAVGLLNVGSDVRAELSVQYAEVYTSLAESYILTDREPENSLIFLGVQLFTTPSVAALLVSQHNFLSRVLDILFALFTTQVKPNLRKPTGFILPPDRSKTVVPLAWTVTSKQKRFFQLFSDLEHLVSSAAVQRHIAASPQLFDDFASFLSLFTGMNKQVRAVDTHVEYESDHWVAAFNIATHLARMARSLGAAFAQADSLRYARILSASLSRIPAPGMQYEFERVKLGSELYPCISYDISQRSVSFHHPLAWFWAELAKHAVGDKLSTGALEAIGVEGGIKELLLGSPSWFSPQLSQGMARFLAALEAPVHTIALVSQVRAGLWVRNGFSMRAQHLHYRDYSLRENAYEQDMFFLQTALVVVDPSIVVATLVERFGLTKLLSERKIPAGAPFEPEQGLALLEELLSTLIALFSDPTYIAPLSSADALRREIIHYLALAPATYSDLLSRVSDRFSDDPAIDRILSQVARFKPPSGSNDQGMYSLNDELFGEVNPNFLHYSRNQREEAEGLVKAWMKRQQGTTTPAVEDLVVVPQKLPLSAETSGPFAELPLALACQGIRALVLSALLAGRSTGVEAAEEEAPARSISSEAVLDRTLQLCLLGAVEQPDAFAAMCVEDVAVGESEHTSIARLLVELEEDDQLKAIRPKARYLVDGLIAVHGDRVASLRKTVQVETEQEDTLAAAQALEAKRAAAKARQAAIMQQFQKAQSAFLQSVEDEEDDEDAAMNEDGEASTSAATHTPHIDFGSCIVCQEALENTAPFGLLGLVQLSRFIRLTPDDEGGAKHRGASYVEEVLELPSSLDRDMSSLRPYGVASTSTVDADKVGSAEDGLAQGFPLSRKEGLHASSCGHMMHLACFEQYCTSVVQRHTSQPQRQQPEDIERREFTCPLCKSLGNVLLPVEGDSSAFVPYAGGFDARPLSEWGQATEDPLQPGPLSQFGPDFERRVDKLSTTASIDDPAAAFRPWLAQASLLTLLPEHFDEGEGRMVGRMLQVVGSLSDEAQLNRPTLPNDLVGYTVASLEIASRGTAEPAWEISEANVRLLQSVTQVLRDLAELMTQSDEGMRVAATSLRQRLGGEFSGGTKYDRLISLQLDPLGQLIEAAVCAPAAFYHVAAVTFYTHLVSSMIAYYRSALRVKAFPLAKATRSETELEEAAALAKVRDIFEGHVGSDWSTKNDTPIFFSRMFTEDADAIAAGLGKHLHAQMTIFLRRAAIVARVLIGAPSEETTDAFLDDERTEYTRLLELLRIPSPRDVLGALVGQPAPLGSDVDTLGRHVLTLRTRMWAFTRPADELLQRRDVTISTFFSSHWPDLFPEHPVPYELLGLPKHLDTLLAEMLERECENCESVPASPALCLFCGELVCAQMFCCMTGEGDEARGECNEHMWNCGWSVGMYYLVKRNVILLLYADRGTFITPPYLDSHGEAQMGDRRVRSQFPQFLHQQRSDELRKIWLTQGIPTYVARKLDAVTDHGGWETF
ncbi:hypothetical protein JCM10908_006456 [Rhodotorula pacifica]|uniref:uncharacterized protein n=1 Tax=Rhodotorula pacifica TaxID=1495444 RepID=UPI0031735506